MLQRLPTTLEQVNTENTPENLLNEICQIIYSLYGAKGITKKVYNNIMNSIKAQCKMKTIFMNSETCESCRLLFQLSDKINLKRSDKYVTLPNLRMYCTWKNIKKSYKNNKFKTSTSTQKKRFELSDGSYSVSDIQDCFEYVIKKTSNSD